MKFFTAIKDAFVMWWFDNDPPPQGGCQQCLAGRCYAATCNMDCRLLEEGCETIIMGGALAAYNPKFRSDLNYDYAQFFMQRVERCTRSMTDAGIEIGDTIERVNGVFAGSDEEFAKMVSYIPRGTFFTVRKWHNFNTRMVIEI